MYTTKIIEKTIQRSAKRVVVKVEFTKNGISDIEEFSFGFTSFSLDTLKKAINIHIDALQKAENEVLNVQTGIIDTTIIKPAPILPTQVEIDREKWIKGFDVLQNLKPLIDNGILTGSEPKIVALKNRLKTDFKPGYINL